MRQGRYVGIKGEQPEHGHGGPRVVGVREPDKPDRSLKPRARQDSSEFEWGYYGNGPLALAHAILFDVLGFDPPIAVAMDFAQSVIKALPKGDFELAMSEVEHWIGERLADACDARLEEA